MLSSEIYHHTIWYIYIYIPLLLRNRMPYISVVLFRIWRQHVLSKHMEIYTRLHSVTFQPFKLLILLNLCVKHQQKVINAGSSRGSSSDTLGHSHFQLHGTTSTKFFYRARTRMVNAGTEVSPSKTKQKNSPYGNIVKFLQRFKASITHPNRRYCCFHQSQNT